MDQKDLAFVFLSLIVVYSAAFTAVIETTENHENNPTNPDTVDTDAMDNNSNHNALLTPPIDIVFNLLSNFQTIAKHSAKNTHSESRQSPASSPALMSKSSTDSATHNHRNSPQIRVKTKPEINNYPSTIRINTPSPLTNTDMADKDNHGELSLIEPHKPGLSTVSDHSVIEYRNRDLDVFDILRNANLLITTVDGKFSVLSAEKGSKQMDLDSSNQPLYKSTHEHENQIIPGIDGQLYLLRKNPSNEEYLEPLPFTIEQIAKNTGYTDSFNTWYLVDPTNTVFWIDSNDWNVCQPFGNIPDITDNIIEMTDNAHAIPRCNDALIVTRIDRKITAVDVNHEKMEWQFKHGEYRVAVKHSRAHSRSYNHNTHTHALKQLELNRFQLWQSLDESSKYTLFLYDKDRGEIKWSKSLSSIVTNVQLLSSDHELFNFYVYHSKNAKYLMNNGRDKIGLWIIPSNDTHIAIAHSNRNPISNHMFLPDIGYTHNAMMEEEEDDEIDEEGIKIIDEEQIDYDEILKSAKERTSLRERAEQMNGDQIRFVRLSFDGDIPTPTIDDMMHGHHMHLTHTNSIQTYAQGSALKIFNPTQQLLSFTHSHEYHGYNTQPNINGFDMQHFYGRNVVTLSVIMTALFIFGIKRLFFRDNKDSDESTNISQHMNVAQNRQILPMIPLNSDVKIVGKFTINLKMILGRGRRGAVYRGTFENRAVAIKRIDKQICQERIDKVENEIDILLKVDHHNSVVRYYAKESDNEFDYIALELCLCSLWDVIKCKNNQQYLGRKIPTINGIHKPIVSHGIVINSLSIHGKHGPHCSCHGCRVQNKAKYRPNNHYKPRKIHSEHLTSHEMDWRRSEQKQSENRHKSIYKHLKRHKFVCESVQKMCIQMMDGLIALHTAKDGCIIHRDIKPQNILIAIDDKHEQKYVCKLADMGMAKLLDQTSVSFDSENCGTLFWNAPELIYHKSISNLKKTLLNASEIIDIHEEKEINNNLHSIFGEERLMKEEEKEDMNESDCESETEDSITSTSYEYDAYESDHENICTNLRISSSLTKKVDIFSLGCVFSFLLSAGHHPYGDGWEQHENMSKHQPNMKYCQHTTPQVYDLIVWMIDIDPKCRPKATECREHPFFWTDDRILSFLNATSDYIEKCHKSHELRVTLEMASSQIIGSDWGLFVDAQLLNDAGKHRTYNFGSMRDYLRLIRNKWNHFGELPLLLRQKLCEKDNVNIKSASKFLHYFTQFAPELVMYCYKLIGSAIKRDEPSIKRFKIFFGNISDARIQSFHEQVRVHKFRRWYTKH